MTIQEKSTELGGGADLAADFYSLCTLVKEYEDNSNTTFECIKAQGIIQHGTGHNGSSAHLFYCSTQDDVEIDVDSTDQEIKDSIIAHINTLNWSERPLDKGSIAASKV